MNYPAVIEAMEAMRSAVGTLQTQVENLSPTDTANAQSVNQNLSDFDAALAKIKANGPDPK